MKKKVSKIDYSKSMLPRTRKEQFWDVFKMYYTLLLKSGVMLLLFFIPLIGYSFFMDFYYVSLLEKANEEIEQTKLIFHYILNGGLVLFSFVALIGLTGVIKILRNLIWSEGIYFKEDFASGVKENFLKNLLFAAIFSIFYLLAYFIYSLFPETLISYFALFMFALIFLPIFFWLIYLNNTYKSTFGVLLRNGLYFYVKTIGWSILGTTLTLLPVFLIFIQMSLVAVKYIVLVVYIIFIFPIILLMMTLYSSNKFDESINKDNYPDYYLRGLNSD